MSRVRWRVLAAVTAGLMCASAALASTADASSSAPANSGVSGVKGDPQPELKPFKIAGTGDGGATAAIEPNGAMVVAYDIANGNGKVVVCVLDRGASKCSSTVTLSPLGSDDAEGTPSAYVFAPSANHVVVLMDTSSANPNGDLLFTSTNGGRSFGPAVSVGSVSIESAALVGGQIVFGAGDGDDGGLVQSVPVTAAGPAAGPATAVTTYSDAVGVGSYRGGALIASDDDDTANASTHVSYAAAGKNFNASGSYRTVGSFANEEFVGISGDALLTEALSGALKVRLFNGTGFGAAHVVPPLAKQLGGPAWWSIEQDPAGRVHVFTSRAFAPVAYGVYIQTTATGASWTSPLYLGNGGDSNEFAAALDRIGSGLAVGTEDHEPVWAYPVLAPQGVSFSLAKSAIGKGKTTVASGKGSPIAKGRTVWLQQERAGGTWWNVASTHENGSGSFSFTIKGSSAGTHAYRAVVSDFAGYLQYGYSAGRALKVS